MQAKLNATKSELQTMIAHWKPEWKDAVNKWSEKVKVVTSTFRETLFLPVDGGRRDYILVDYINTSSAPTTRGFGTSTYDLEDAAHYQVSARDELVVPRNLAVDIFRHFVTSFGGKFLTEDSEQKGDYYYHPNEYSYQWLYLDDENKRHHHVIHEALNSLRQTTEQKENAARLGITCSTNDPNSVERRDHCDHWERIWVRGIQLDGKLLPAHYIDNLLKQLLHHQVAKMMEHHFYSSDEKGEKIIHTAKQFYRLLAYRSSITIERTGTISNTSAAVGLTFTGANYLFLLPPAKLNNSSNNSASASYSAREAAKMFNMEDDEYHSCNWTRMLKNPALMEKVGKLTTDNVRFIICCFIDAEYDRKETIETIEKINSIGSTSSSFPSAADDFSNFDPPHLRGVLSESVLSRKLQSYALGKEEIRSGEFALVAPSALTNIVAEYFPVDILNT